MSELKVYVKPIKTNMFGKTIVGQSYYLKSEADKVIAEKDAEIAELKKKLMPCLNGDCILTCEVVEKYGKENAELKADLAEKDKEIAKLKDKCQMHDFFWEGCGFDKLGFKNSIAVREAFDRLEAENEKIRGESCKLTDGCLRLKQCRKEKANIADELRHSNYKRCLAMAKWCRTSARYDEGVGAFKYRDWYWKWFKCWLTLAEEPTWAKFLQLIHKEGKRLTERN